MSDVVRLVGLREFRSELRAVDSALPKEVRSVMKAAADRVAEGTRSSFASRPGVAPKVAPSVKALASQGRAQVRIGGDAYPYALGSNFGAVRYKQFPMFAGHGDDYSLYKTIRDKRDEIVGLVGDGIDGVMRRAFPS